MIYGIESSSGGGKIVFDGHGITVDGGFFHDVRYRAEYSEIEMAIYSTVLPKMRFVCCGDRNQIPVGLSLRHTQLAAILRLLKEHGVPARRMAFLPHIVRWWKCWYGNSF